MPASGTEPAGLQVGNSRAPPAPPAAARNARRESSAQVRAPRMRATYTPDDAASTPRRCVGAPVGAMLLSLPRLSRAAPGAWTLATPPFEVGAPMPGTLADRLLPQSV